MNASPSPRGLLLRGLIIFTLMSILLMAYYWTHRPFGIDPLNPNAASAGRIIGMIVDVLTVGVLALIAGGVGAFLLARLDHVGLSHAEIVALDLGIGLGLFSVVAAALGLLGFYNPPILWGGVILGGVIARKGIMAHLRHWRALLAGVRIDSAWTAFLAIFCGVLLALAALAALAPQTHWDTLVYHLPAPLTYLRDGAIRAQPENFYLGFPQNLEVLYGVTVGAFGRDTAAAPLHFVYGVIGLLATMGLTRRFAGAGVAWLAAALLLGGYSLWALFGWAYVDLGSFAYGGLALSAALTWHDRRETNPRGWLIMMGVIVGLAAGVKYTAGLIGVSLGLYVLLSQPRRVVTNGVIMLLAALAVFAVWMVKGALLYQNPVYPFVFHGLNWDAGRMNAFNYTDFGILARNNAWQIPLLPFAATIYGVNRLDGFGFTAGAWLLTAFALLPLVWFALDASAKQLARAMLIVLAPLLVYWAIVAAFTSTGMQTRLLTVALPAFAVAGAVGLDGVFKFPKKPLAIGFIVRVALIVTLILAAIDSVITAAHEDTLGYLFASRAQEDYMYANTQAYYNAVALNLPPDSQVRFMWEPRTYYCPPTTHCIPDAIFDNWTRPQVLGLTDDPFAYYREQGDDYLLVSRALYDNYLPFSRYPELESTFFEQLEASMILVWTDGVRYSLWGWRE